MRKWWVGIIIAIAYIYIFGNEFNNTVNGAMVVGIMVFFCTGKKKKKEETETVAEHVSRIKNAAPTNPYEPGQSISTWVSGVTFENRQEIIRKMQVGDQVKLQREPRNPYDENAIVVTYLNRDLGMENRRGIGYIPREIAARIAKHFDQYATTPILKRGKVVEIDNLEPNKIGIKIIFNIPSESSLEADRIYYSHIAYPMPGEIGLLDMREEDPSDWCVYDTYKKR